MSLDQEELRTPKVDLRSRVRMPPETQRWILDEFERNRMSAIPLRGWSP